MRTLFQVELCGLADGRRSVRLHHRWGTSEGVYRDGPGAEALLALGPDLLWDDAGRLLARRGAASLVIEPGLDPEAAATAGLSFLRQRGAVRVVVAASGALTPAALRATGNEGVTGVALIGPDPLACAGPLPGLPALVIATRSQERVARQLHEGMPASELYLLDGPLTGPDTVSLLCTFALDATTREPFAPAFL